MPFPDRFLDELTDRTDIVELVNRYVPLQRRGNRHVGLCPFHSEKTPSFTVTPERQMFYCFGCGAGGGSIQFAMRAENLSFPDAVRFLAEKAGLSVPEDGEEEHGLKRETVYAINRESALFFVETLRSPAGEQALSYLRGRGFTSGFITRFGLGAAPDAWDGLLTHLTAKGYDKLQLLQAGVLASGSKGQIYDRFRGRVVFPILDLRKNVIGFSARVLDDSLPKYINSPDSPAYAKNRHLFALNIAKDSKSPQLLLAEGCMDVLALHQAGFDNAVASLGTSLTDQQARLMSRYTKEVVIAYDSDAAGTKAGARATGLLTAAGLKVRMLRMNGAKDPDEYIRRFGRDAFDLLLRQAENHLDYKLHSLSAQFDLQSDAQRVEFLGQVTELLADIPNSVERDVYAGRAAAMAQVSQEALLTEVKRARGKHGAKARKEEERRAWQPAAAVQPKERALRYQNLSAARAEETIIRMLLTDPGLTDRIGDPTEEDTLENLFQTPLFQRLYRELRDGERQLPSLSAMGERFTQEELSHVARLMEAPLPSDKTALMDCLGVLERESELKAAADAGMDPLMIKRRQKQKEGEDGNGKRG